MRPDMKTIVIERPRYRGHDLGDYPRAALGGRWPVLDEHPLREAMGRGYSTKKLSDNLAPLNRYLGAQVGRPWRSVHSDIAQNLSFRNATQAHIYQHLREMLHEHVVLVKGAPYAVQMFRGLEPVQSVGPRDTYYVCPRTSLLRVAPRTRRRSWARPYANPDPSRRRVLSPVQELHRIGEHWFAVAVAPIPRDEDARLRCRDCVVNAVPMVALKNDSGAPEHWRFGVYAATKRQLAKREIRKYGLREVRP